MKRFRGVAIAVAVLALAGGAVARTTLAPSAVHHEPRAPLPRAERPARGEPRATWAPKTARVPALRVDIDTIGAHTHANWVYFRLPFDTTDTQRVRDVRVTPSCVVDPDVSAVIVLDTCVPYEHFGPLATWSTYTVGGVGSTLSMSRHPTPPTDDPTILAVNVPTRVANYVACGWKGSAALREPSSWSVDVTWEER